VGSAHALAFAAAPPPLSPPYPRCIILDQPSPSRRRLPLWSGACRAYFSFSFFFLFPYLDCFYRPARQRSHRMAVQSFRVVPTASPLRIRRALRLISPVGRRQTHLHLWCVFFICPLSSYLPWILQDAPSAHAGAEPRAAPLARCVATNTTAHARPVTRRLFSPAICAAAPRPSTARGLRWCHHSALAFRTRGPYVGALLIYYIFVPFSH
jgi:hypothetical protein